MYQKKKETTFSYSMNVGVVTESTWGNDKVPHLGGKLCY